MQFSSIDMNINTVNTSGVFQAAETGLIEHETTGTTEGRIIFMNNIDETKRTAVKIISENKTIFDELAKI